MQPIETLTMWHQINEVQTLQNNTRKYLQHYEQSVLETLLNNPFLQQPFQHHRQPLQNRSSGISLHHRGQPQQVEDNDEVHISRIFKQITLQLQQPYSSQSCVNVMEVELSVQGTLLKLQLNRNHIYSLSNFSSFKDLKQKQQISNFSFEDLVTLIQAKSQKKLSQQGIQSIIEQLAANINHLSLHQMPLQQPHDQHHNNTKYSQSLVTLSDSNILNIKCDELFANQSKNEKQSLHKFDYQLNNNKKHKPKVALTQISNSSNCNLSKQEKKTENDKTNVRREQKENSLLSFDKKSNSNNGNKLSKQLRIIKRTGQSKSHLSLWYHDSRQVEHFCIDNKIYGKDKEKIYKAIKNNAAFINLQ